MQKAYLIDPPEGWRFGFPKSWDQSDDPMTVTSEGMAHWLLANEYPQEQIDLYWPKLYVRVLGPTENCVSMRSAMAAINALDRAIERPLLSDGRPIDSV
ncbi:MAG: hypothetical protein IT554_00835 [Sphingomonadaceae bacterium]|nr:hypothetical protein [Sphingobium sp.]MBP9158676.1 hypothetical protein [Sphingobium sp.]MCC6480944.1 hypothetical protein [Sphingomonadaceae bacterium]